MYAPQEARVWIPLRARGGAPAQGFWIDPFLVTNEDFAAFVEATGWVTTAERPLDPTKYPHLSEDERGPSSMVFRPKHRDIQAGPGQWARAPGVSWRHPLGPGSGLQGLWDHPVVHVSWTDAVAYAAWVNADLPTAVEWEAAVSNPNQVGGTSGTTPVGTHGPSERGLFDVVGAVWQWTRDEGGQERSSTSDCLPPDLGAAVAGGASRILKGGSYLCGPPSCLHLAVGAQVAWRASASAANIGFRCVVREPRRSQGASA